MRTLQQHYGALANSAHKLILFYSLTGKVFSKDTDELPAKEYRGLDENHIAYLKEQASKLNDAIHQEGIDIALIRLSDKPIPVSLQARRHFTAFPLANVYCDLLLLG
jgi:hypothetical protein